MYVCMYVYTTMSSQQMHGTSFTTAPTYENSAFNLNEF